MGQLALVLYAALALLAVGTIVFGVARNARR